MIVHSTSWIQTVEQGEREKRCRRRCCRCFGWDGRERVADQRGPLSQPLSPLAHLSLELYNLLSPSVSGMISLDAACDEMRETGGRHKRGAREWDEAEGSEGRGDERVRMGDRTQHTRLSHPSTPCEKACNELNPHTHTLTKPSIRLHCTATACLPAGAAVAAAAASIQSKE